MRRTSQRLAWASLGFIFFPFHSFSLHPFSSPGAKAVALLIPISLSLPLALWLLNPQSLIALLKIDFHLSYCLASVWPPFPLVARPPSCYQNTDSLVHFPRRKIPHIRYWLIRAHSACSVSSLPLKVALFDRWNLLWTYDVGRRCQLLHSYLAWINSLVGLAQPWLWFRQASIRPGWLAVYFHSVSWQSLLFFLFFFNAGSYSFEWAVGNFSLLLSVMYI